MLRRHRHAARLTLEQLAELSGVSARTVSDMERGRSKGPQHRTVTALADALALAGQDRTQFLELARDGRLRDHWTRPAGLCELPRSVDDFTGRAAELAWVDDFARTGNAPGSAAVGVITGAAGLGKTTFTIRAAHALRPQFPDGVLFLDLFGMSQRPLAADDALGLLLRALGAAEQELPADVPGRASLYRSLLRDKRVLIVLDNAASEDQVRSLLPGDSAGQVVVTSRRLLAGLEGVRRLVLRPLSMPEATALLTGIVGERAGPGARTALTRLAELCGGLPLALRIIGNRLVSRPGWDPAELADRLADEERRLDQFKAGDLKIANAFGMSYEQLADSARRVFRRLSVVPGRDFDAAVAAVAGRIPVEDAWDALDELVDLGLLQDSASGRYRFHDLVRLFARQRLAEEESAADGEEHTREVTRWLLRMATMCGRWFEPAFGRPDQPEAGLLALASEDEASGWLRANVDNWLGAMRAAAASGEHSAVLDCAESMHWFSDRWMHGPHWREVFTLGAQAAAALGDLAQQAAQLNYLAWVDYVPPKDAHAALRHAAQALDLATRSGATVQVAWSHEYTAVALRGLQRPAEARASAAQAAELFEAVGDIDASFQSRGVIADCLIDEGRYREALDQHRALLALLDDDRSGMTPSIVANVRPYQLIRIAQCLKSLGRRAEAISALTESIALMEALALANMAQAHALRTLGELLDEEGRTGESRGAYARAAALYESIGDHDESTRCRDLAAPR